MPQTVSLIAAQAMVEYFGGWVVQFGQAVKSLAGSAVHLFQERPFVGFGVVFCVFLLFWVTKSR